MRNTLDSNWNTLDSLNAESLLCIELKMMSNLPIFLIKYFFTCFGDCNDCIFISILLLILFFETRL